ncbi:MAG: phospho-sugar mutase [Acutalibacteraceae bacterium]
MNDVKKLYKLWKEKAVLDGDLIKELAEIENDSEQISDIFYKNLQFGTAGLRGIIGAGTNRMNVYTIGQATQGLAEYLNSEFKEPSVAIAYDSRIKSELFAREAASVLAANAVQVHIFPRLVPTPMLSYAVRTLGCSSGIIITASHNPSRYNGFKCYDKSGYQMTDEAAQKTFDYISKVDVFEQVKRVSFEDAVEGGTIKFIGEQVFNGFYEEVLSKRLNKDASEKTKLKIIYTPLNGAGNLPVRKILGEIGIKELKVVESQENPDGNFPTCPYPNPEIRQSFEEALKITDSFNADLLLATDPDCDRVGIAVLDEGEYRLMTGNETGAMLTEYILSQMSEMCILPENAIVIKSIVSTPLIEEIARNYKASVVDLLTGFKYVGEYITALENKGEKHRFVFAMEESYGYLSGTHARDKDAVTASMLICEMAAYYKAKGLTLYDFMNSIYEKYGFYISLLNNYAFEGAKGMQTMGKIMSDLRSSPPMEINGGRVKTIKDYKTGEVLNCNSNEKTSTDLPSSDVLHFILESEDTVIVRPSGTEPKLKVYITSKAESREKAEKKAQDISDRMKRILGI